LLISSAAIVAVGFYIPLSSIGAFFGFIPPPVSYYGALCLISGAYFVSVQIVKMWFVRRFGLV
jgi:P-type Mg2+ transporter